MTNKVTSGLKVRLGFVSPLVLVGFVLVVALAIVFGRAFSLRNLISPNGVQELDYPTPTSDAVSSQNSPIEEWRIYLNNAYGYSIKYPPAWTVKEELAKDQKPEEQPRHLFFLLKENPSYFSELDDELRPGFPSVASISVSSSSLEETVRQIEGYQLSNSNKQQINVDGVSGIRLEGESVAWDYRKQQSATEPRVFIVLPLENNVLIFSFSPKPVILDYGEDFSDTFKTMLTSLDIH